MITLWIPNIVHEDDKRRVKFRKSFLDWCQESDDSFTLVKIANRATTYDIEVSGLSESEEGLWLVRWGKGTRSWPNPLPVGDELERIEIPRPYEDIWLHEF